MASSRQTELTSAARRVKRSETAQERIQLALFAFCALLALTLLGPAMTFYNTADEGQGSLVRQLGYAAILLLAIVAIRPVLKPQRLIAVPWPLVIALAWCWLSVMWAIDPIVALRRIILTTIIIWSVFSLVRQLGYERTLALIRIALVLTLAANFICAILYPDFGIHRANEPDDTSLVGDWRGIMAHKNTAGLVSALTVIFFLFDRRNIPRLMQIGVIALATAFLVLSSSRTSIGVGVAAVVIGLFFTYYRARYRKAALALIVILAIVGATIQNIYNDPLLRELSDPASLSGRTLIWEALIRFYRDHPIFGSGYGSFWDIGNQSPIYHYATDWVVEVKQGHNGFLDLLVQIGPLGLLLVVFATAIAPLQRLLASIRTEGEAGALIAAAILFCIAHNGSESSLFVRDTIGQVFLMLALAMLWTITSGSAVDKRLQSGADMLAWANRSDKAKPAGQVRRS